MKEFWYGIPSRFRRGIAYFLVGIGITVLLALALVGLFEALDKLGLATMEQFDSESKWAVEYSFGRLSE